MLALFNNCSAGLDNCLLIDSILIPTQIIGGSITQDITRYGEDLYDEIKLVDLIKQISKIKSIKWIRLHYCYPELVTDELLEEINKNQKVCKYLDIPLQHIDDKILKDMNRRTTEEQIRQLFDKLNSRYPNIAVRSTFIVGFPGETKTEFAELEKFLSEYKLNNVGFFAYSKEYDTKAYSLDNRVSETIKQQRLKNLVKLQTKIQYKQSKSFVGRIIKCVCDDETHDYYILRSEYNSPEIDSFVYIPKNSFTCTIGKFYKVKITEVVKPFDLKGEIL